MNGTNRLIFGQTESFGCDSIMEWGGIFFKGLKELVPVNDGKINADIYINIIIVPMYYLPYIGDNSRPHIVRVGRQYLEEVEKPTLNEPARSLGINPIECVWDHLG